MKKSYLKDILSKFGVPVFFILLLVIVQLLNSDIGILRASNLLLVFQQASVFILLALGLSVVMIGGETDLSIAGAMGFTGAVFVTAIRAEYGLWPAVALTILASLFIGVVNGILVGRFRYPSFLVTLATMFFTLGLQNAFTNGLTIWIEDRTITRLDETLIMGIPIFMFLSIVVAVIYYFLVYFTRWGFNIRVVGENSNAADEVGLGTKYYKFLIFVVAALFYGIAGVIEPIRVSGSVIYSGQAMLLPAMTACFLGSTMFVPGKVNVAGTFFAAFLLSLIINVLTLLGIRFSIITLFQGLLLLGAVALSNIHNRSVKQNLI